MIRYQLEGRTIVYQDESGFALDAPRTHGYSSRGKRCYGSRDWHARDRVNAIGAIVGFEFLTVSLWDCYIDGDVFYKWITEDLLPKVSPNSVIVMDGASFHKCPRILKAIEAAQCLWEFLPPYSPDLNPIEMKWAQVKNIRRKLRCDPFQLFSFI